MAGSPDHLNETGATPPVDTTERLAVRPASREGRLPGPRAIERGSPKVQVSLNSEFPEYENPPNITSFSTVGSNANAAVPRMPGAELTVGLVQLFPSSSQVSPR